MSDRRQVIIALHERDLSAQLAALLEKEKFETKRLGTGRELLEILDRQCPDLIVLGVLLPDANGLELAKRIKQDAFLANARVLVVSSFKRSGKFALEVKTRFGADAYYELPLDPTAFIATVAATVGGRTAEPAKPKAAEEKRGRKDKKERQRGERPAEAPAKEERIGKRETPFERTSAPRPTVKEPTRPEVVRPVEITNTGRLGPVLLPELFLWLYQRHENGLLEVRAFDEQREILFRDGVPTAIRTNFIPNDALGHLLVSRGVIDSVTLEHALREAKDLGKKLGEVLLAKKVVSPHELTAMLHVQARRKLNTAFRWTEGTYKFTGGIRHLPDTIPVDQDMLSIIIAGISRHFNMAKLEERLYLNRQAVVERIAHPELTPKDLHLGGREWRVLELIDGQRTLGEVMAEADLSFSRTFQVLYLFLLFGLVRFADGDRFFRLDGAVANRARAEAVRAEAQAPLDEEEEAPPEALPLEGDLASMPFPSYLYLLYQNEANGRLILRRGDEEEMIQFVRGMPVQVLSNQVGPLVLGQLLVDQGKITTDQRDRMLEIAEDNDQPLGEVLLAKNLLTPHELFEALLGQLEKKLLVLFAWKDGFFEFEPNARMRGDAPPIRLDLARLLLAGLDRVPAPARLDDPDLGFYDAVPMKVSGDFDLAALFPNPRYQRMLGHVDGRRTVGEITARGPLEEEETALLLYRLVQLGLLRLEEADE